MEKNIGFILILKHPRPSSQIRWFSLTIVYLPHLEIISLQQQVQDLHCEESVSGVTGILDVIHLLKIDVDTKKHKNVRFDAQTSDFGCSHFTGGGT